MAISPPEGLVLGCGYLGRRVAVELVRAGYRVTATSRKPERLREFAARGLHPVRVDLAHPERAPNELWKVAYDVVLYAVAPGRGGNARLAFLEGATRSLAALRSNPPRCFIYTSSTGVYAQRDGSEVDETSPTAAESETHLLIRAAERTLLDTANRPPAIVLRLGGLYGPGRSPLEWLRRPEFVGRQWGNPSAYMNWIHVDDAAQSVLAAARRGRPGEIYLVVDGAPVRRRDFYGFAARLTGTDPPKLDATSDDQGKRCSNRKLLAELGVRLRYPDYRAGLAALRRP